MKVIQIYMKNNLRNYNYIVYSETTKEAIFIDPLDLNITIPEAEKYGVTPKYLLNTHHHHDHIRDNQKFLNLEGTQHLKLQNNEVFKLSETESIKAIDTPGHVKDHQCFILIENQKQIGIISGDAIFNAGIGNTKNGGNLDDHFESTCMLNKILTGEESLYPSHDYLLTNLRFARIIEPSNATVLSFINKREVQNTEEEFMNTKINDERLINPFFRLKELKSMNEFKELSEKEIFLKIRKKRDEF